MALFGESCRKVPKAFLAARERGAVVVSTPLQENVGIAVVEAVRSGCFPLPPDRLSYPELIPVSFHQDVLYRNRRELVARLVRLLGELPRPRNPWMAKIRQLARAMNRYIWRNLLDRYDGVTESWTRWQGGPPGWATGGRRELLSAAAA